MRIQRESNHEARFDAFEQRYTDKNRNILPNRSVTPTDVLTIEIEICGASTALPCDRTEPAIERCFLLYTLYIEYKCIKHFLHLECSIPKHRNNRARGRAAEQCCAKWTQTLT